MAVHNQFYKTDELFPRGLTGIILFLLLFFIVVLATLGPWPFHTNFRIMLSMSTKMFQGFSQELHQIYRSTWKKRTSGLCCFPFTNMVCLSIQVFEFLHQHFAILSINYFCNECFVRCTHFLWHDYKQYCFKFVSTYLLIYRNAIDFFCNLVFCDLAEFIIGSRNFPVDSFRFFIVGNHVFCKLRWFYFFLSNPYAFQYYVEQSGECTSLPRFRAHGESIQSFTIKYLSYRFFVDTVYQAENFPLYTQFTESQQRVTF